MKLALLGTGMIVKEVLPVLQEIDGIDLVAILSTPRSLATAEELARQYGIEQASSDYEAILSNPAVDTVYVALPNHLHYAYAKEALLAGKHVICEKPFTLRAEELEDLVTLAAERQLFLLEAITNQYLPNFFWLKERLPELGDLKIVTCNYSQYSSRYDAFKQGEIAPAFDPKQGGGALRDLNIYNIHLVVGLFGSPVSVNYLANMEKGVDTSGMLIMDYQAFKVVCIGSKDSSAVISSTIQGNKGSLTVHGPTNSLPEVSIRLNGQAEERVTLNRQPHRMADEFMTFRDILAQDNRVLAQAMLDHSRAVMRVLDLATGQQ
ncbi:Gfo/Idh/MocA family protein [Streptococcus cuniculipharyngis]|uniref:Gfo/Idh/MocA family oxidoreductase n=1 Tax=Streptococcus cuniculipharyngis TaxID=1562651 RepID=A0A5C5SDR0_9STRE|nr:Gfo/Idh/MocA family oxidoreductase [Streptococcus cuniculipharyngis]TWS98083.1 Gfo/Idh/MocA family oxidoreductase [Streptococcus cuniculipharyngis]